MQLDELVGKYILLRDRKDALKKKYDEDKAQLDTLMDKIEAVLLKSFQESGLESVKTPAGTAYKSTRTSATIADWDTYLQYVRDEGAWELLEKRCNKSAVEQHKAANDALPPGVNWREELVVGVRRPKTVTN